MVMWLKRLLGLEKAKKTKAKEAPKPKREQPPKPDKDPPTEIVTTMAWLSGSANGNGFSGVSITLREKKKFWQFDYDSWTWVPKSYNGNVIWSDVREIVPNTVNADAVIDALEADAEWMRVHHARFIERSSKYNDDTYHYIDREGNVRYCDGSGTARVVYPK